jgi:transcription-repair coupling factor (superfamily II helicase)
VIEPVLELRTTAVIPEGYIEDPSLRLNTYRKISSRSSIEEIGMLRDELNDRYGSPPKETERLLDIMELKITAKRLAVTGIKNIGGKFRILLSSDTTIDTQALLGLHKNREGYLKFLPEGGIELDMRGKSWDEAFRELKLIMQEMEKGYNG